MSALQVVHSRTFGTAGKEGGTAVHMLLPLVDFLNHGGDEVECFPGDDFAPTANVRYVPLSHCKSITRVYITAPYNAPGMVF